MVVEGCERLDALAGRAERLDETVKPIEFSKRVALVPLGRDAARAFVLTATALDGAKKLVAHARVVSGYVSGEVRYAKLLLEEACIGVKSCDALQSCSAAACADARVDAEELSDNGGSDGEGVAVGGQATAARLRCCYSRRCR